MEPIYEKMLTQLQGQFENLNNNAENLDDTELNYEAGLLVGRLEMLLDVLPISKEYQETSKKINSLRVDITVFSNFAWIFKNN